MTKKIINEYVLAFKRIIEGVYENQGIVKHITEVNSSDYITCPECKELVKNHSKFNPPHYEHYPEGKECSFKV